jgi:hypothetical protein
MSNENQKFPTSPDSESYFFESADDFEMGVMTRKYENGHITKRLTLDNGTVVIIRELFGRDQKHIQRFSGGDQEKAILAGVTVAATVDGQQQAFEYYDGLKLKYVNRITYAYTTLNF